MTDVDRLVVLHRDEAALLAHVLAVFERLLRQGNLQPEQLRHLVAGDTTAATQLPDVEMAEAVAEAAAPLHRQL